MCFICRWSFLQSAEAIRKQEFSDVLPRASIQDLGVILMGAGYEVPHFVLVILFFSRFLVLIFLVSRVLHGMTSLFFKIVSEARKINV